MRVLHLYRPTLPGQRAQTLQVLHTAAAMARLGAEATVLCDRGPGAALDVDLAALGLAPHPRLQVRLCPALPPIFRRAAAGLWFRSAVKAWAEGPPGLVYARDLARLGALGPGLRARGHRVVLEVHALDAALDAEAGRDPGPSARREAAAARLAEGVVANCAGTLRAWREAGLVGARPALACDNAADPGRARPTAPTDGWARCFGSFLPMKGLELLLAAAALAQRPLELVGGEAGALSALPGAGAARVAVRPPLPYAQVPEAMAASEVLLLPLRDNRFGRCFASPLKLWDYLLTDRPIVAPALPTLQEPADRLGLPIHWHRPEDPADLARAWAEAAAAGPRPRFVRSWDQRAEELLQFLGNQTFGVA